MSEPSTSNLSVWFKSSMSFRSSTSCATIVAAGIGSVLFVGAAAAQQRSSGWAQQANAPASPTPDAPAAASSTHDAAHDATTRPADAGGTGSRTDARSSRGSTTAPAATTGDAYAAVVDRNIFVRDRRRPVQQSSRTSSTRSTTPASLEASLVLRGVIFEEGAFRAYFENRQSNTMVQVAAGDPLARGRVSQISIDAVEFETTAGHVWIKIGDNLVGASVGGNGGRSSTPTASSGGSSSQPALSGAAADSIEERMRLRRQQREQGR